VVAKVVGVEAPRLQLFHFDSFGKRLKIFVLARFSLREPDPLSLTAL